jgi:hypothetical protein
MSAPPEAGQGNTVLVKRSRITAFLAAEAELR